MDARAISAIISEQWAMRPSALENIIAALASDEMPAMGDVKALEQYFGRPMANTRTVTVRDGVAIVPVNGPLFRYENLFTYFFGGTTYETLATDIRAAMDDQQVRAIVLSIDSPGGAVKGANELAKQIRDVRGVKPIIAYGGGDMGSAAYWIGSAADEIIGDESALFGSIGAMITIEEQDDPSSGRQGRKRFVFTSSQSPLKNPSAATTEGAREIQRVSDELAQVFIESVANNRGISVEKVLEQYGKGAVYTGTEALKRGMIDSIGTLEAVIARFSNSNPAAYGGLKTGASFMDTNKQAGADLKLPETMTAAWIAEHFPAVASELRAQGASEKEAEARAAGAQAERDRLAGIEALAMPGAETVVTECKADPEMTAEKAAVKILQAVRANPAATAKPASSKGADHLANMRQTESELDAPKAGSGEEPELSAEDAAKAAVAMAKSAGVI